MLRGKRSRFTDSCCPFHGTQEHPVKGHRAKTNYRAREKRAWKKEN